MCFAFLGIGISFIPRLNKPLKLFLKYNKGFKFSEKMNKKLKELKSEDSLNPFQRTSKQSAALWY